ncbi:MAG: glycosyltransferase [Anaerolineales bacterium]
MAFAPSLSVLASVYRGEEYLPGFFENLGAQTVFPELELVLVLNDPSPREKTLARDFTARHPDQVQILFSPKLETLGASWNRAWLAARAPYLAIWNVDDRRVIDSLQRQLAALEENPEAMLCYGDYVSVGRYGEEEGPRRHTPPYGVGHFRRALAQGGAFWLLRRNVSERIGYFDEQFRIAADMEFSFRLAAKGLPMVRAQGLLGFFTNAAQGLSTRDGVQASAPERTAIQLRYGVFDKVRREFLNPASAYRLDAIKISGDWIPLTSYLPEHEAYLRIRRPLWMLGSMRNAMRRLLQRLGLLPALHKAQDKYLKREI